MVNTLFLLLSRYKLKEKKKIKQTFFPVFFYHFANKKARTSFSYEEVQAFQMKM